MAKVSKEEVLQFHKNGKAGKIEISLTNISWIFLNDGTYINTNNEIIKKSIVKKNFVISFIYHHY